MRVIAALLMLTSATAQTRFEVASLKPSPPAARRATARGGPGTPDPGLFICENVPLLDLLTRAYRLQDFQLSAPDWTDSARFSISATIPAGANEEQFHQMLQNLLTERFKMTSHHEKKETQVYNLVVAKTGPKLAESVPTPADDDPPAPRPPGPPKRDENGFPILPPGRWPTMMVGGGRATKRSAAESMDHFAEYLASQVQRPVTNATGLKGKYDFTLRWALTAPGPSPDAPSPTLFQALQQQLGLKLESSKGMVDVLVIDHLEKTPVENE